MQRKLSSLFTILISLTMLLVLMGPGAVFAQDGQPPSSVPPHTTPFGPPVYVQPLNPGLSEDRAELLNRSEKAVAPPQTDSQALTLGQPGLSFRYVQTFGMTGLPYLADDIHLNKPNGLFIDPSNNLFTVEENGHRLLRFNSSGVNTMILGHAGQPWAHDDFLAWPRDMTKDPAGNIWVVFNFAALKQFDASGNVIQVFPENEPWLQGDTNDRFNRPWGIAFGPNGYMYISDQGNHRIQVYNISGGTPSYVETIGQTGVPRSDNSGFNNPGQIAFDSLGRLYVVDGFGGNFRVQRCTKSGTWTCQTFFGQTGVEGNDLSHMSWSEGIAIKNDIVYIADGANYRIVKCTVNKVCSQFAGISGVGGTDNSHFWFVSDVAVDSAGNVFVSDIDNARIQKFNSAGVYQSTIGVTGVPYLTDTGLINSPWGVAVNAAGDVYTVENLGYRLLKFNAAGSQQWSVGAAGAPGDSNDRFGNSPEGNPAIDASGRIYVPDTNIQRVQIFNANGSYYATLGTGMWGTGNYDFAVPNGVAISPLNGDIYVADMGNHRIQVFTSARVYKATLGQSGVPGSDNQHFNWPRGVAVAPNGVIYVADTDNYRVQKCSFTTGTNYTCTLFAGETGVAPDGSYARIHPISVAVDSNHRVYVVDDWNGRIMVYNSAGAFLTLIGGDWSEKSGGLRFPAGVAVDAAGNVYVADHDNHRIQKFAPGVPGWQQANINGFGNRANESALSMAVFNNQLYAGAGNWDGSSGASIWRTSNGLNWSPAMTGGFGQGGAYPAVIGMTVFNGQLYAGSGWGGAPGQLWRSSNGTSWNQITGNGMGVTTGPISTFAVYGNTLYAGTCGDGGAPGAQIWRSTTGNSLSWASVVMGGLTSTNNNCVTSLKEFKGALYAAVENQATGAQIWRSTTGNSGSWTQVNTSGFGQLNDLTGGFAVYDGYLYIGTRGNPMASLWRSNNGTNWSPVTTDGFGHSYNWKVESLFVFDGALYAGLNNDVTGLEVWRFAGGTWTQVNTDGFGDSNNRSTLWSNETVAFNGAMYMGVYNGASGLKIWRTLPMSISGNVGVAGATLSYVEGLTKTVTSQTNGSYTMPVSYQSSGTLTPSHVCFTFSPASRNYNNITVNQTLQNFSPTIIPGCANISILIAGASQARFGVPSQGSTRASFTGVNNGPVKIASTNSIPLIGAERVIYKVKGISTSFTELMGLPDSQLDTAYWLPWYNNVDTDTQLRFANVSGSTATVHVYIGEDEMAGSPYTLLAGESTRKSFPGVNNGPVQIVSNVPIVAAERVIYKVNGTQTSFSEMMALPNSALDTTYWLPWYNNVDLDTQLRFANVSGSTATVHVYVGNDEMPGSPFTLLAGESTRKSFPGVNNGPVKIESDVDIVAAERVIYKVNGTQTSFTETMGLPNAQLDTTYWLPWYNNKDLDSQLRFANVSATTATVHVYIGGVEMAGSPFTLLAGESTRQSFANVNNGPVQIVSNVNIVAAERVIYKVNGVNTSFSEMMGLPNHLLDTAYWLPWYNNLDLDTQLRFGVP